MAFPYEKSLSYTLRIAKFEKELQELQELQNLFFRSLEIFLVSLTIARWNLFSWS